MENDVLNMIIDRLEVVESTASGLIKEAEHIRRLLAILGQPRLFSICRGGDSKCDRPASVTSGGRD